MDSIEPVDSPMPGPASTTPRAARRSYFRDVPWRVRDVLGGFAPDVLALAAAALLGPVSVSAALAGHWLPALLAIEAWMLVYPLWIARRRHAGSPRLPRPRAVLVETLFALPALLAVMAGQVVMFNGMAYLFGEGMNSTAPWEPVVRSPNWFERLAFMILAVSVVPVAEEVFFRGMLYNALRQRLHPVVAALLQAIVFGLSHPFGLAFAAIIAWVGLALAAVYEWRKTLLAPVILHALVNAVAMAIMASSFAASANAPMLGVEGAPHERGCRITKVIPGSAADIAGLRIGDVVTAIDRKPVVDIRGIAQIIRRKRVGDTVSVEFIRDGAAHQVDPILQRRQQ